MVLLRLCTLVLSTWLQDFWDLQIVDTFVVLQFEATIIFEPEIKNK